MIRADGSACKPLLVYEGTYTGRINKEVKRFSNDSIACCVQPKAWKDTKILEIWVDEVLKKTEPTKRKLILMHNFRAHNENV